MSGIASERNLGGVEVSVSRLLVAHDLAVEGTELRVVLARGTA